MNPAHNSLDLLIVPPGAKGATLPAGYGAAEINVRVQSWVPDGWVGFASGGRLTWLWQGEGPAPEPPRAPRRVQRTRTKGGGIPAGAVYIGRPGPWGNPFRVGDPHPVHGWPMSAAEAVRQYRGYLAFHPELVARARRELAGRDLACWCRVGEPCHGDELLLVAANT